VLGVGVHLSLDRRERWGHAQQLLTHLDGLRRQYETPHVIVGGDFNERPDGATWTLFADAGLRDAWSAAPPAKRGGELTFPADAPDRRIDGVLVSAGLTVDWVGVPEEMSDIPYARASDHRPVLAVLRLPAR
jgi:endonuclease/exonuclease/phosphatase family metal-dependent hydrolase